MAALEVDLLLIVEHRWPLGRVCGLRRAGVDGWLSGQFRRVWCLAALAPRGLHFPCPSPRPTVAMHPAPCTHTMRMRQQGARRAASPYRLTPRHQPHPPYFPLPQPICVAETLAGVSTYFPCWLTLLAVILCCKLPHTGLRPPMAA